jgi:DNA topoisomerase-1
LEVANGDGTVTASIPPDLTPADLNPEQVETLLRQKTEGPEKLGVHPETGESIFMSIGSYGPYVQLGEVTEENKKPKRASLPKGMKPEAVTLDLALGLLSLPRTLGQHPATGGKIQASLGRFGPYVVHDQGKEGKEYRSLKAEDDVLSVSLERALELLAQPKGRRGSRGGSKKPLRQLGLHPEDNQPVDVYEGPYGIYVKHGKLNAGLPKGETVESVTLEKAIALLEAKAAKKKTSRKSTKGKAASKGKS